RRASRSPRAAASAAACATALASTMPSLRWNDWSWSMRPRCSRSKAAARRLVLEPARPRPMSPPKTAAAATKTSISVSSQIIHASSGNDPEHDAPVAQASRLARAFAERMHVAVADRAQPPALRARARGGVGHRLGPALRQRARCLGIAGAGAVGADLDGEVLAAARRRRDAREEPALPAEQRLAVERERDGLTLPHRVEQSLAALGRRDLAAPQRLVEHRRDLGLGLEALRYARAERRFDRAPGLVVLGEAAHGKLAVGERRHAVIELG